MHRFQDFLAVVTLASGITAQLETLDLVLRILSALIAITAGGLAIYRHFKPKAKAE